MSQQGARLQNYNNELVKYIEDLRVKRSDLSAVIEQEEGQKREVEDKIKALKEKLEVLEKSLENKNAMKMKYDKTIEDTEGAFAKILESSQTLLGVVKRETDSLNKSTIS